MPPVRLLNSAFADVVCRAERLMIRPMEARSLVFFFRQIESATWLDMIDVPLSTIRPAHPGRPLAFNMSHKFSESAPGQFDGASHCAACPVFFKN
jgi:hypothetical protein